MRPAKKTYATLRIYDGYIWAVEQPPSDPDFFLPLHAKHLDEWCPSALKFLGLPPGWRFLVAGDYEEAWEDVSLFSR